MNETINRTKIQEIVNEHEVWVETYYDKKLANDGSAFDLESGHFRGKGIFQKDEVANGDLYNKNLKAMI